MAGTLYVQECTRVRLPRALIEYYGLDIKIAEADATYKKNFPLAKFPAYIGEKGFKLTETIAISIYCMYKMLTAIIIW